MRKTVHEPAELTDTEWCMILGAFEGLQDEPAIMLLREKKNAPQTARDLFGERAHQGEESPNNRFRSLGLDYRIARGAETERGAGRAGRLLAIVRWPSGTGRTMASQKSPLPLSHFALIALRMHIVHYRAVGTEQYMAELQDAAEASKIPDEEMFRFYLTVVKHMQDKK